MIPVYTFAIMFGACLLVFALYQFVHRNDKDFGDNRIVIISDNGEKRIVPTNDGTVKALLKELDIKIDKGDRVEPALATKIDQDQFRINIYRAVPIEVVDGGQKTFAFSAAATPRSVATEIGEKLYAEDKLKSIPSDSFMRDGAIGARVVIDRATPVNLNLYGTPTVMRTHAKTFGELLKEKKIKLAKGDEVTPSLNTPLAENVQVAIVRNGTRVQSETLEIAMPVQAISDDNLAYGTSAVRQAGSPGKKLVTYQVELKNNQIVSKKAIQEVVTVQPVTQVMVVGTSLSGIKGDMARAGISPSDYTYADYIISHESGWCPTKIQGQHGGCPPLVGEVPSYGGYGLCQSTPGSKMATAGADWRTNPVTQLRWCTGYANSRHGGWAGAYNFWIRNHWW